MHYLESLNEPQREAVTASEGPMMIIAGAGSGKTRVLTYRIAFLIEHGIEPFQILSLTFTNKAAKEMRERIQSVVGNEAKNLWMGTFHSVFAKILRFEGGKLGYQSNFTIYDADDSKSLLKTIIKEKNLDDKLYKPNVVFSKISKAKNNLISWQAYSQDADYLLDDENSGRPKIWEIYKEYALRCFKGNAMDFDDLLFNTNVLFEKHLDVLNKYQHKFKYVLIDEFQDTNISQYNITKRLAALHQNICVVGDDAQSIYAFRGANIQNILNFEHDYNDLKVIKLEQNYRSTSNIVNAANSVIKHNTAQLPKNVWTSNSDGRLISLLKTATDGEEGKLIATSIFEEKMQNGLSNKDFAILYRTNAQSRAIEENLRRLNIGYKIIGGISFYQRKEVKDLLAYLKFTVNPQDVEAFKRIINYPKRGIGNTSINKVLLAANELDKSVWEVAQDIKRYFNGGRMTKPIEDFAVMIRSFQLMLETADAFTVASHIAKQTGILKELYDDKTVEGKVRYDNLQELLNAIKAFVDNPEEDDKSLDTFLQEISLMTSSDQNNKDDAVTLMTIHMSKGLEFESVYLAGLEENLFPSQMMLESREDLEEERRLFYVAITRAKNALTVSYALQRYRFGQLIMCEPSRFIDEIDPKYIQNLRIKSNDWGSKSASKASSSNLTQNLVKRKMPNERRVSQVSPNFKPSDPNLLTEGLRVEHGKFGMGTVVKIETFGNDRSAIIEFDKFGKKTLILSFAKLMIH